MTARQFLIIIEKGGRNYSAYVPDLPGCVATGRTRRDVTRKMQEAIQIHIAGMRQDGMRIPKSVSYAMSVKVALPPVRRKTSAVRSEESRRTVSGLSSRRINGRTKRV